VGATSRHVVKKVFIITRYYLQYNRGYIPYLIADSLGAARRRAVKNHLLLFVIICNTVALISLTLSDYYRAYIVFFVFNNLLTALTAC